MTSTQTKYIIEKLSTYILLTKNLLHVLSHYQYQGVPNITTAKARQTFTNHSIAMLQTNITITTESTQP